MGRRYFPTWTAAQLLEALDAALADQSRGQTIVSGGSGDVNVSGAMDFGLDERLRRIKHDLCMVDPTTYPPEDYLDLSTTRVGF